MGVVVAGCASVPQSVPHGDQAYSVIPAPDPRERPANYQIGPFDTLDVTVFQEPDLSLKGVQVDAAGQILFPLIGAVRAVGMSSADLSREIARRLGQSFLQNPQVSTVVTSSVSQKVTVEGSVTDAGVFEIKGQTTLLEALAMAKGPTRTAALSQVVVFRNIDGVRNGAVFNVAKIRRGEAKDPAIVGSDVIVVGFSAVKAGYRDFLATTPLLALFRAF